MFDFRKCSKELMGTLDSYYEAAAEVNAEFTTSIAALPDESTFAGFLENFKARDTVEITMSACINFTYQPQRGEMWRAEYRNFLGGSETDDCVKIRVHISKKYNENHTLSIYCLDEFLNYYMGLPLDMLLKFFVLSFSEHPYLRFEVLDKAIDFHTHSIGFCAENVHWPSDSVGRVAYLKKCESASLFLNRIELPLTPYDFELLDVENDTGHALALMFKKLETLFSFLYLANSSYMVNQTIILQFSPAQSGFDYEMNAISDNRYACQLFKWAFEGENAVERAGIARNVICLNCKNSEDVLALNEKIYNSVKSNYVLYQKKTTQQYIEMKKQISSFIIEASKQIQEITHDLIDGLKNNFIAVIMFLITIVLTDSVEWDDFLTVGKLNQDLLFVTQIFIVASIVYLVVTFVAMIVKWSFFRAGYNELKANYKGVLDENDIENAFKEDRVIKSSRKKIVIAAIVIGIVWIGFLIVIYRFFHYAGKSGAM